MIRFRCECGKKLKADESIVGRKVRCTQCEKVNIVPRPDSSRVLKPKSKPEPISSSVLAAEQEPDPPISLLVPSQPHALAGKPPADDQSRFKLAPEFDPEPGASFRTSEPAVPMFEFDLSDIEDISTEPPLIQVDTEKPPSRRSTPQLDPAPTGETTGDSAPEPQLPSIQVEARPKFQTKTASRFPLALVAGAIVGGLALLIGFGYLLIILTSGSASFPDSFENRPAVQNYRNAAIQLEKTRRTMVIMGDAYIGSKSPAAEEVEQIRAFQQKMATALDPEPTLREAFDLIAEGREAEATRMLNNAAQSLLDQRPEMAAKTVEYTEKSK